jgi:hypothetical protein
MEETILILDSDIYLPDNFNEIVNNIKIEKHTLYGTSKRFDYYSYHNFKNNIVDFDYRWSKEFQGYFQLYKYNPTFLYNESKNCSSCDLEFHKWFKNKIIIHNLSVCHLGKSGKNWNGRNTQDDFIM